MRRFPALAARTRHHLIHLVTLERCEWPSDSSAIICNCMEGSVFGSAQADIKVSCDQDIHSVRRQSTCHTYKSPRHGRLFYLECFWPAARRFRFSRAAGARRPIRSAFSTAEMFLLDVLENVRMEEITTNFTALNRH